MDKVIVERPRYGSRARSRKKGYRKYTQRTPLEALPKNESLLGRWKGMGKSLNEHLGPMRRFLRSNVGRPWNKVHQELCEHVSFDNAVQAHVLAHIYQYVHRFVEIVEREVRPKDGWHRGRALVAGEMYVCPDSGLLKTVRAKRQQRPTTRVSYGTGTQYLWRDNAWWELRVRKMPAERGDLWDVWLERAIATLKLPDRLAAYGGDLFATSKRLLTRDETKQLYRRLRSDRRR
jgi:hypothetical protein